MFFLTIAPPQCFAVMTDGPFLGCPHRGECGGSYGMVIAPNAPEIRKPKERARKGRKTKNPNDPKTNHEQYHRPEKTMGVSGMSNCAKNTSARSNQIRAYGDGALLSNPPRETFRSTSKNETTRVRKQGKGMTTKS